MALLETPTAAKIERLIRSWQLDNPAFLWAPTRPSNFLFDQQRRLQGRPVGRIDIGYGGVKVPVPNGSASLKFPSNLGIGINGDFFGMLLVWIKDPAAVTGCFLKIGDSAGGVGVGGGANTFEDAGDRLIVLRESIGWSKALSASFAPGLNVLSFYRTSESVLGVVNLTTGGGIDSVSANYDAPESSIGINGYAANRSSNATVCAVAIWPGSYTNAQTVARRSAFAAPFTGLAGRHYLPLFTPEQILVPVSAGGGVVISATPGDAVASGPLAQINQARLIAGTPGNAAADGVVAKIDQARRIDATPGNAAADGVTAQINQARLIAAGPGNAVADGVTAKIDQARRIDATAGNAVAAGVNAQIITAGAVVIDCTPGAAVADGVLAQINQARIVLATAGAAVAAGVDALISTADDVVINATPGNAFAQGAQAIIVRDVLVLATPGAAVAAGVRASIIEGGTPIYAAIPATRSSRRGVFGSRPAQLSTGRRR